MDVADACADLRRRLTLCERNTAGRCADTAKACDKKREELQSCQRQSATQEATPATSSSLTAPATTATPSATATTVDRNGRKYSLLTDGAVLIDDSSVTKALPPPPDLPPLKGPPSCGLDHCVAVTAAFEAISWATSKAASRFGQLGWQQDGSNNAMLPIYTPRRIVLPGRSDDEQPIVDAAAGDAHTALVDADGGLWLCGSDRWTQLGQDNFWAKGHIWQREPCRVPSLAQKGVRVRSVALGADHSLALDDHGQVWAFGFGQHGQCFGEARRPFTSMPAISAALSTSGTGTGAAAAVQKIWARGHCSCALLARDGGGKEWKCVGRCEGAKPG